MWKSLKRAYCKSCELDASKEAGAERLAKSQGALPRLASDFPRRSPRNISQCAHIFRVPDDHMTN